MKTTLNRAEITILASLQTEISFWSLNWGQREDKLPLSPNLNWPLPHTAAPCPVTSSSMRLSTIEVIPGHAFFHRHCFVHFGMSAPRQQDPIYLFMESPRCLAHGSAQ